jgi:cob(I)alamin adenosyltransferase
MGNRLSKITTRTGDDGTTGLADGARVVKNDPRIVAIGEVDELNCWLGLLLTETLPELLRKHLAEVQHELFDLGGSLSLPGASLVGSAPVARLEAASAELNAVLPPLKEFVLPGGSSAAAICHLARAVCRRTERAVYALHTLHPLNDQSIVYLNRLSDLLFIAARILTREEGTETLWRNPHSV